MDRERILVKLDELEGYIKELKAITPDDFESYERDRIVKRASERLLHISIEAAIDVCSILVRELRLGVPAGEGDFFDKLSARVITKETASRLKEMKNFRNVIVHRYGGVDDREVYSIIRNRLGIFEDFEREVLDFLRRGKRQKAKGLRKVNRRRVY